MKSIYAGMLLILGLILLSNCTHQARKTHLAFENESATYEELSAAIEGLKRIGYKGATHEQYRILKALRHMSKYMKDIGKREMAVRALVFLAAFNDNSGIEDSCYSRLTSILEDDEDLALRLAVIDAQKNIVIAKSGYTIQNRSLFSDDVQFEFIYPEIKSRKKALTFLMDHFEDLPEYLQYKTINAFRDILTNPVTCLVKSEQGCEESDADDQVKWKRDLWERVDEWLQIPDVLPIVKLALIRLGEEIPDVKDQDTQETWLQSWGKSEEIEDEVKVFVVAALNKIRGEYSVFNTQLDDKTPDSTGVKAENSAQKPYLPKIKYQYLESVSNNVFWYNNANKILELQLFLEKGTLISTNKKDNKLIPSDWMFSSVNDTSEKTLELKEIVFPIIIKALQNGYTLSEPDDLAMGLQEMVESGNEDFPWLLDRILEICANAYPTLYQEEADIEPVLEALETGFLNALNVHAERLYLNAMLSGLPYYQEQIEAKVCPLQIQFDILTRHLAKTKATEFSGMSETSPEEKRNGLSRLPGNIQPITAFCGEQLSADDITNQ